MNTGRNGPEHDEESRRQQDDEIDLRYRTYRGEDDNDWESDYEEPDRRVADGWSTETKSDTPWWVKAGIAAVSLIVVVSLLAGLAGPFLGSFGSDQPERIEYVPATVVEVVDMRTIIVDIDGEMATVRYIGIEPLPLGSPWYDIGQLANQELVADREVLLEADGVDQDDFGRLLRYVYVDRNPVNGLLIRNGLALLSDESDGLNRHYADLRAWSEAAQYEKRGHWSDLAPEFAQDGALN